MWDLVYAVYEFWRGPQADRFESTLLALVGLLLFVVFVVMASI